MATVQTPAAPGHSFPTWVVEAWQTSRLQVKLIATAQLLWDRILTPDDRRRLGNDFETAYARYGGAAGMWKHLRGVSTPRAVIAVATRLNLLDLDTGRGVLRAFGEEADDPVAVVDAAVAAGGLVLVESPREAYWEGRLIPLDWERAHARSWDFLWELARASKGRGTLDGDTFRGGAGAKAGYMKHPKHRLVKADEFPISLADRLVPAGRGSYRLDLPPECIRVFEQGPAATREWVA